MVFGHASGKMGSGIRGVGMLGALLGFLLILSGCAGPRKLSVEVVFKGRCVDAKGQGIPSFSLAVGPIPSTSAPTPVTVTTAENGTYETRLMIAMPPASGDVLGPKAQKMTIAVSAPGRKSKNFTVTADQIFVRKPNTLNVRLEPS